jgi:hypothetical protein
MTGRSRIPPPWDDEDKVSAFVRDLIFQSWIETLDRDNAAVVENPEKHFKAENARREHDAIEAWTDRMDIGPLADLITSGRSLEPETWTCFSEALWSRPKTMALASAPTQSERTPRTQNYPTQSSSYETPR